MPKINSIIPNVCICKIAQGLKALATKAEPEFEPGIHIIDGKNLVLLAVL